MSRATQDVTVRMARPEEFSLGAGVAVAAKQATGLPADVEESQLPAVIAARQHAAAGVWLAFDSTGVAVGHAIAVILGDDNYTWGPVTDPDVAAARRDGKLLELGGLSVHPDHHRRGIARLLGLAQLAWARDHDLLPVGAAWNDSAGSTSLCNSGGVPVGTHPDYAITLFRLNPEGPARSRGAGTGRA